MICPCGKEIDPRSKRCKKCASKLRIKIYYCIDCGAKTSSKHTKRCQNCYHKYAKNIGMRKGKKNGMFGIKPYNYKSGFPKCIDCGNELKNWYAIRCKECWYKWNTGKRNGNWNNGSSFEPYPLGWTKTFKEQIRYRDGYKCQICGCPEVECYRKLDVHHIDYNKDNLNPKNLVSLCKSCHMITNGNRKFWENYFKEKIVCYQQ